MKIQFPQELISQDKIVTEFITEAISQDKLAQAYLLTGESQEYKQLLVKSIAKTLNCTTTGDIKPCNTCTNCQWIESDTHPEVPVIIDVLEGKSLINIEQIETLKSQILKSSKFFKIIYFPNAERSIINATSANSLLKYIEEPPPNTLFIFAARDTDNVLNTIVSRCQPLYINKSTSNLLSKEIEDNISPEELFNKIQSVNNYHDCTIIAEGLEAEDIERLGDYVAESSVSDINLSMKNSLSLIQKAQERLQAFCNKKLVIEELLWELSTV